MWIKTKSHLRATYLDMNNFYGWAINAIYGSNLESGKSNKRLYWTNTKVTTSQIMNKCVSIVQDQIKMSASVKNVVAIAFMC